MVKIIWNSIWFYEKMFIWLLFCIVNGSNCAECVSLNNQQCMTQPTLINLHSNEYIQGLHYFPFALNLDKYVEVYRWVRRYSTLNDLSSRVSVRNKTKDFNLHVFNMITGITELKTLKRHM